MGLHFAFQDAEYLYLVMDYMAGGDLMGLLISKDTFPEAATRIFAAEMIMAIGGVHSMGYIHRDVKPDNILIDDRGHLKLADLGLATKVDDGDAIEAAAAAAADSEADDTSEDDASAAASTGAGGRAAHRSRKLVYTVCGTCDYMAPEVLLRKGYDKTADWWAVGAIVFECIFGYAPFWAESAEGTARKIVHWRHYLRLPAPSEALSAEAIDFMTRTLTKADRRLGREGTKELKSHPWFAGIDWDKLASVDGPYVNARVRAAGDAIKALRTLPRSDGGFEVAVRSLCVSFDEAKIVSEGEAEAAATIAPEHAASTAGKGKVVGYTYSRDGDTAGAVAPPARRSTKAAGMLANHRRSRAAAAAAATAPAADDAAAATIPEEDE